MQAFPMFIKTTGRRVVIVGGGEQAAQKTRLILKTDARIELFAPELDDELTALVSSGRATQVTGPISEDALAGAAMVFIATGCFAIDVSIHAIAKAARVPVNVVDQPALCDITTPALVDRDPVVIAIGTEGTAPVLARQIKTKLEADLPQTLGGLAALAGRLRDAVACNVPRAKRRAFWRWVFGDAPGTAWAQGDEARASAMIKAAISDGGAPRVKGEGAIAVVGAGPGAGDLMTLRAAQRLQEADVIFYGPEVDKDVLELARRDAEREEMVGGDGTAWDQDYALRRLVAEATTGSRVVLLHRGSGAAADLDRLKRLAGPGISIEMVLGVADDAERSGIRRVA